MLFALSLLACSSTPPVDTTPAAPNAPVASPEAKPAAVEAPRPFAIEEPHEKSLEGFKTVLTTRWGHTLDDTNEVQMTGDRAALKEAMGHGFAWEPIWRITGVASTPPTLDTSPRPVTFDELTKTNAQRNRHLDGWHLDGESAFVRQAGDPTVWTATLEPGWKRVDHAFLTPDGDYVASWLAGAPLAPPVVVPAP